MKMVSSRMIAKSSILPTRGSNETSGFLRSFVADLNKQAPWTLLVARVRVTYRGTGGFCVRYAVVLHAFVEEQEHNRTALFSEF
jgi:hypothetical protein